MVDKGKKRKGTAVALGKKVRKGEKQREKRGIRGRGDKDNSWVEWKGSLD